MIWSRVFKKNQLVEHPNRGNYDRARIVTDIDDFFAFPVAAAKDIEIRVIAENVSLSFARCATKPDIHRLRDLLRPASLATDATLNFRVADTAVRDYLASGGRIQLSAGAQGAACISALKGNVSAARVPMSMRLDFSPSGRGLVANGGAQVWGALTTNQQENQAEHAERLCDTSENGRARASLELRCDPATGNCNAVLDCRCNKRITHHEVFPRAFVDQFSVDRSGWDNQMIYLRNPAGDEVNISNRKVFGESAPNSCRRATYVPVVIETP